MALIEPSLTAEQQVDVLLNAMANADFWVSIGGSLGMDDIDIYLHKNLEGKTGALLTQFTGTRAECIAALLAYQRLTS